MSKLQKNLDSFTFVFLALQDEKRKEKLIIENPLKVYQINSQIRKELRMHIYSHYHSKQFFISLY